MISIEFVHFHTEIRRQKNKIMNNTEEKLIKKHFIKSMIREYRVRLKKGEKKVISVQNHKNDRIRFLDKIQTKLIIIFFIPVLLMALLGVISYLQSSAGLNKKYEEATRTNIAMMGDYLSLGFETIESKANILTSDNNIRRYYSGYYDKSTVDKLAAYRDIKTYIFTNVSSEQYISDIYIFGKNGDGIATSGRISNVSYEDFTQSELAKLLTVSGQKGLWIGNHSDFDQKLNNSGSEYSLSYIRSFSYDLNNKQIGYIIFDVSKEYVETALDNMNLAKGSIMGCVINDEKEILRGTATEEFQFSNQPFYKAALDSEDSLRYQYVTYQNIDYLFVYNKLEIGNNILCALVPKSQIIAEATKIRNTTILVTIIAGIIVTIIGTLVAGGFGRDINKINKVLLRTAEGDLSGTVEITRKDEFRILSDSINHMIDSMKQLIHRMADVSNHVTGSVGNVAQNCGLLSEGSESILTGIDNMEQGIMQQAEDAELCLEQMSALSKDINAVYERANDIETVSKNAVEMVTQGLQTMDNLGAKVHHTSEITKVVIDDIVNLEVDSRAIDHIVGTIGTIAKQTNLLSLNASIEAARAGEVGRGFAVVAEEIRMLANQSNEAVKQIDSIIKKIQNQTQITVESARQAESVVLSQEEALVSSVRTYSEIKDRVDILTSHIKQIIGFIRNMENSKDHTLKSIESISSTLEETTAMAEEFNVTVHGQMKAVEILDKAAAELQQNADYLQEAVNVFNMKEVLN